MGAKLGLLGKGDEIEDHVLHPVALTACVHGLFLTNIDLKVEEMCEGDIYFIILVSVFLREGRRPFYGKVRRESACRCLDF